MSNRKNSASAIIAELFEDVKTATQMLVDVVFGRYRAFPRYWMAVVIFSMIYLLSPMDLVPDVIPVIGLGDDLALLYLLLKLSSPELDKYRRWRKAGEIVVDGKVVED